MCYIVMYRNLATCFLCGTNLCCTCTVLHFRLLRLFIFSLNYIDLYFLSKFFSLLILTVISVFDTECCKQLEILIIKRGPSLLEQLFRKAIVWFALTAIDSKARLIIRLVNITVQHWA